MAAIFSKRDDVPDLENLLDQKLYDVPGTFNEITWADSLEGTLITGATGSGKTSAIAKHIGKAMLSNGFGMVIFCAKKDERIRWERYIQEANREQDKIVFNQESDLKFNFLRYELERIGEGAGDIFNAVNIIMSLNEQGRNYQSTGGSNKDERFWDEALKRLISRTISLLQLSGLEISIHNMRKIVAGRFLERDVQKYADLNNTIATNDIDIREREDASKELKEWKRRNFFVNAYDKLVENNHSKADEIELTRDYWDTELPRLSDRTASTIVESFMGIVEVFLHRGILKDQFSEGLSSEIMPESIIRDKSILIIDFPIKEFGLSGIFAAIIYKSAFQEACERRKIEDEYDPKPVALFIDEYQNFCNPNKDSLFQATARSSWVATVYITQSISNLFFVMGNDQPEARTDSLLGNLNTKYFANNADVKTNTWASEIIGKQWVNIPTYIQNDMRKDEISKSVTQQYHYKITPDHYTTLKTGRKANKYKVEAVVFKPGKLWGEQKRNFDLIEFDQR